MKCWKIRKISNNEYHVIEGRFVNEPEYVLAICTGPSPAGEIVSAMRLAQSVNFSVSNIHNAVFRMKDSLEKLKFDLKDAQEGRYDEEVKL